VPHDRRSRAAGSRVSRRASHCQLADRRQRTPRVDFGTDCVAVMDEEQMHRPAQAVRAYGKMQRLNAELAELTEKMQPRRHENTKSTLAFFVSSCFRGCLLKNFSAASAVSALNVLFTFYGVVGRPGGMSDLANRGSISSRMASSYNTPAMTIAPLFTSASTIRS